jgi:hypothetical protein
MARAVLFLEGELEHSRLDLLVVDVEALRHGDLPLTIQGRKRR